MTLVIVAGLATALIWGIGLDEMKTRKEAAGVWHTTVEKAERKALADLRDAP